MGNIPLHLVSRQFNRSSVPGMLKALLGYHYSLLRTESVLSLYVRTLVVLVYTSVTSEINPEQVRRRLQVYCGKLGNEHQLEDGSGDTNARNIPS